MIIPPFAGVTLVEYRDHIELTPYYWYREFVGLGRFRADKVGPQPGEDMHPFFRGIFGKKEIWVIARWKRFEDGSEETINLQYLDPEATEAEAQTAYRRMVDFTNLSKEELESLANCLQPGKDDHDYIEERFPDIKEGPPDPGSIDEGDLYQARLKVLGGLQPETARLIGEADIATDPKKRGKIEREAVQAYFAELAHYWTEEQVLAWQKNNPLGTEWMRKFARVLNEPKAEIDPVDYELAFNWLRRKYNLLTAKELAESIWTAIKRRLKPGALKKRRERLGLTSRRPPGPRPNSEQEQ